MQNVYAIWYKSKNELFEYQNNTSHDTMYTRQTSTMDFYNIDKAKVTALKWAELDNRKYQGKPV